MDVVDDQCSPEQRPPNCRHPNTADCPEREAPVSMHTNLKAWLERANLTRGRAETRMVRGDLPPIPAALHIAKEEMERGLQTIIREGYGEQHPEGENAAARQAVDRHMI